jgi:Ca2+-transporting ATPase
MVWATASSFLLLLLVMYVPFLQPVFDTVPLGLSDWLVMLPFMLVASIAAEITKLYLRRKVNHPSRVAAWERVSGG